MTKLEMVSGKCVILLCAILIGIPLGILSGVLYFLRVSIQYPFDLYRATYAQWLERVTMDQADIWTRHIYRMEENKKDKQKQE